MKKEKEKIRYSVVMNNALKISLIMTFLIYVAIIIFYNFNTSNSCMNNIYNTLNNEEMHKFASENLIFNNDKQLQTVMIAMAM